MKKWIWAIIVALLAWNSWLTYRMMVKPNTNSNESVSNPSDMKDISPEVIAKELGLSYEDAFVNLVSVDVEEYAKLHFNKPAKKTLTIPEWLNKQALSKGINFSQVLQEALLAKIQTR